MYFPVDACVDELNLSLLAISSLLSLDNRSMLIGFGITTSSILSICLAYRQTHSLAAGMLSTRASPGAYCLPFLQVSNSVEKMGALVFKQPSDCGLWNCFRSLCQYSSPLLPWAQRSPLAEHRARHCRKTQILVPPVTAGGSLPHW